MIFGFLFWFFRVFRLSLLQIKSVVVENELLFVVRYFGCKTYQIKIKMIFRFLFRICVISVAV